MKKIRWMHDNSPSMNYRKGEPKWMVVSGISVVTCSRLAQARMNNQCPQQQQARLVQSLEWCRSEFSRSTIPRVGDAVFSQFDHHDLAVIDLN